MYIYIFVQIDFSVNTDKKGASFYRHFIIKLSGPVKISWSGFSILPFTSFL